MKGKTGIPVLVVALLLLGGVAFRPSPGVALAQPGGPPRALPSTAEEVTASGGGYHLTALAWQVSGTASGGHYRLSALPALASTGSGCCCTYLPCVTRSYQP